MKSIPVNCPGCNSLQKFAPHTRVNPGGWTQQYIVCRMCKRETIIKNDRPTRQVRRPRSLPHVR